MGWFQQNLFHHFWSSILFSTNFQTLKINKYNLSAKLAASFPLACIVTEASRQFGHGGGHAALSSSARVAAEKKTSGVAHRQAEENGEESSPERRSSLEEMASEIGACRSSGQ
jgi:hypothetical protein